MSAGMNVLISVAAEQDIANSGAGAAHLFHTSIFRPAGVSPQPPQRISGAGSEFPDSLRPVDSPDAGSITAQDRPAAMARVSGHRRPVGPIGPIRPIRHIRPVSPVRLSNAPASGPGQCRQTDRLTTVRLRPGIRLHYQRQDLVSTQAGLQNSHHDRYPQ